jgi:oxalate decarboxylase
MTGGPWSFSYNLLGAQPNVDIPGGGEIREASAETFPALNGLAVFYLTLEPGAVRIPHWHDANEVQYLLSGSIRVGMTSPAQGTGPGADLSYDLTPGMIGFVPMGWFHYIENTGTETAAMLIIFNSDTPDNFDISWSFKITPPAMLQQVFGIPFQNVDTNQIWIAPKPSTTPGGGGGEPG